VWKATRVIVVRDCLNMRMGSFIASRRQIETDTRI
jgi:hypothetical protein